MRHITIAAGTAALVAASMSLGCKMPTDAATAALPGSAVELAPAMVRTQGDAKIFSGAPKITKTEETVPDDGMSHVKVKLNVIDDEPVAAPKFSIKALPGAWSDAVITLFSATASTGFANATHRVTLPFGSFSGSPLQAAATFPPLRPAGDYTARAFLRNDVGGTLSPRLAGSLQLTGQALNAGANTLTFNISVNGAEATYAVNAGSSTNLNVVTGNNIVAGDTVTLATGIAANQPGIDHIDVRISGAAYSSSTALLARLSTPASWNSFTWNTTNTPGAPATFVPATLVGGTGTSTEVGTIDIEAYHANDSTTPIATSSFDINVFGRPTVTVQVQ
jgi:hypothetical protein